eukprot:TRINITY_DN2213_c0_g1_i1.p1 TRINITY_DN2213_c0_g1~~TRINITY_DN2213_c0_g1_i1.p1  ORF type:complete len:140 (-),score=39.24 TRINITY_DN2213_c0_g1_i1:170-589(-)
MSSIGRWGDDKDIENEEESRVSKHVKASQDRARGQLQGGGPKFSDWQFVLKALPQDPGQPVSVDVNGANVFVSGGNNSNDVDANFTAPIAGTGVNNTVVLTVPVMNATVNRTFSASEGVFVKFEFTGRGLSIVQQSAPF